MRESLPANTLRLSGAVLAGFLLVGLFSAVYGAAERADALEAARAQAARRATLEVSTLLTDVAKFKVLPYVLTELPDVTATLVEREASAQRRLNERFSKLAKQTGATVLYAVDKAGVARSASNAGSADSFVGHQFQFRPYFSDALRNGEAEYFAQGSVTGRPGLFIARRVGPAPAPAGVVVVKVTFDRIASWWRSAGQSSMVIDRDGIVVVSTDPNLLFRATAPLSPARRGEINSSRQFGNRQITDTGLRLHGSTGFATDARGREYLAVVQPLPILGWRHVHLEPVEPVMNAVNSQVRLATLIVAMFVAGIIAALAWLASRRRRQEAARQQLEAEVTLRTAELTDAYDRLQREGLERVKADSRYRAAREELAQANRLGWIGTIITSVAHELNQPVAAIRAAADNGAKLLARGKQEQTGDNLSLIVSLTERIGTITAELLSYGRRDRNERRDTDLNEVVSGAMMLTSDSFRRCGVAVDVQCQDRLPTIRASRIQIEQVLVNLLQNALDAIAEEPAGQVRLTVKATTTVVSMVVEDNGPGVADDQVNTIFQPFYTDKPNGTGLGLGISRDIVRDYGGTLTVSRSALGGAAFTVELPLNRADRR